MKTAKEILQDEKTWNKIFAKYPFEKYEEEMILAAMEEYADEVAKNLHKPLVSGSLPLSVKFLEWLHNKVELMETDGCRFAETRNSKWKMNDKYYTSKEIIKIYTKESGNCR